MKKREGRLRSIFMLARKSQTLLYGSFTFHRNPESTHRRGASDDKCFLAYT